MSYSRLQVEQRNSARWIWLNRPDKRNALDGEMVREIREAIADAGASADVRSIVIAGRGSAFCAGADLQYLREMSEFSLAENMADSASLALTLKTIYESPKPVIARVHGPAIAGGCGLATVCDIIIATSVASFGYTEVRIGFIPAIVLAFLVRKVSAVQARELVLTGRIISAREAMERGLVTTLIADEFDSELKMDEHILSLTDGIAKTSGTAVTLTKEMLAALDGMPLASALDYAANMNALARMTPDCQAGISSFLNKQ